MHVSMHITGFMVEGYDDYLVTYMGTVVGENRSATWIRAPCRIPLSLLADVLCKTKF